MRSPHQAAISPHCCAAPATSPVCPPIARRANATMSQPPAPLMSAARSAWARPRVTRPSSDRNNKSPAPGGGERVRIEPAGCSARAIGARRLQKRERRQRRGAGERGDQRQAKRRTPEPAVERRGQRADAQDERKRDCDRAIGADAAVAHDLELPGSRRAAAEAVGHVREPILVQCAGRRDERGCRQRRAKEQAADRATW